MRELLREVRRRTKQGDFSAVEKYGVFLAIAVIVATLIADTWFHFDYELAANLSLLGLAAFVISFTIMYTFWSRWSANRIGRIYWVKCIVLSLVLGQIALSLWWDLDYPFRQQIRFAIYTLGAIVYVPMLWTLRQEQRRQRSGGPE